MKYLAPAMFAAISIAGKAAWAEESHFACLDNHGFMLSRCSLQARTLADEPRYGGQSYEATFRIKYSFPCHGHQPDFGVRSAGSFTRFALGADHDTIEVTGPEAPMTYDPRPAETLSLSYAPGCKLLIHEVTSTPSVRAAQRWIDDAKRQARIIALTAELFLLAKSFESYHDWSLAATEALHRSIHEKTLYLAEMCDGNGGDACIAKLHFAAVGNALARKITQQPELPRPEDLQDEAETVVNHYREQLILEVEAGRAMADRFRHFGEVVEQSLELALKNIPEAGGES